MDDSTDRRTFLRAGAAGCTLGLAGCLGVLDGGSADDGDDGLEFEPSDDDGDDDGEPDVTLEEWPSFQYDAQNTGHAPGSGPTEDVTVDWTFEREETMRGGPVIADGTVFVGCDDGELYALDLDDGSLEWSVTTRARVRKHPAIYDNHLIVSTGVGVDAYDTRTGDLEWSFGDEETYGATTPVVHDGTVVFGTGEPYVYALDAATGAQYWRYEADRNLRGVAAIHDGSVYIGDISNLIHVHSLDDGTHRYDVSIGEEHSTGVAFSDDVVYTGGNEGGLHALDMTSLGERLWEFEGEEIIQTTPAITDEQLFVMDQSATFYALSRDDGEANWRRDVELSSPSAPAVVDGTVYVGDGRGTLYAYDAQYGSEVFTIDLAEFWIYSPAVVEDTIVVGSNEGHLWALTSN